MIRTIVFQYTAEHSILVHILAFNASFQQSIQGQCQAKHLTPVHSRTSNASTQVRIQSQCLAGHPIPVHRSTFNSCVQLSTRSWASSASPMPVHSLASNASAQLFFHETAQRNQRLWDSFITTYCQQQLEKHEYYAKEHIRIINTVVRGCGQACFSSCPAPAWLA